MTYNDSSLNKDLKWLHNIYPQSLVKWQMARKEARADRYYINKWPLKHYLIDHYEEILKDAHLYAIVNNRKAKVLGEKWSLVNDEGVSNTEAKKLLEKKWFNDFIKHTLDAIFFGYSLIELDDTDGDGLVDKVFNIQRRNVVPEYNAVRSTPTDNNVGIDLANIPNAILIDTGDLGMLEMAGPLIIQKRFALPAWTEHAEIFSTNFMVAKADVNDANAVARLKADLQSAGRERIAIISPEESLDLKEQSQSDTHKIYNELIARINSELSKLFVGQTMTSDQGSSYSQADVHKDTAQEIAEQDQQWVADHINDCLIPKLIELYNYPLQGLRFKWNDSRQAPLKERIQLFDMLLKNYDISPEVIEEFLNVEVEPKLQMPSPDLTDLANEGDINENREAQ